MGDKPDEPLPTMQLPAGVVPDSAAAPVMPTMQPTTASPLPATAPPAMPQDWRYTEGREIARGGMGRVVEATDTVLGRTVAMKEALSHDPEALRRFARETRITARLEHPAIVPVHDAGFSPNGAPFYVMRKIGGRPLEELVAMHGQLEDRLALVPHIVAAANAVAHAHARGIVHRDIKPSNILVGELGETIVIDWGLAKAIGEADEVSATPRVVDPDDHTIKTRAGIVFGTPGFMAPEQLRGSPVDEKCDVYALGATLYHLLARKPPHHSKDPDQMMRAAVKGPPQPLREIVAGVPPDLETIIDKALAHDATKRYQNAGELAEELQRFLTGRLVAAHHYTAKEKLLRFVRRNRALVMVSAGAALAMIVGGTIAIKRVVDERDRADEQAHVAREQQHIAEVEKQKVIDGYQQLTLAEARHRAEDDPTRAAAMVRPLLSGSQWQSARDVIAAARAHGIAYGLPASPKTLSLEPSRDGMRLLAAGDDGLVRIHDLAHRTTREVADVKVPVRARFGDGERTLVLYGAGKVIVVDASSGTRREIAGDAQQLVVSGPIAYWVDRNGALWKLDLAGNAPMQVPLDEAVRDLAASPDGRWIALAGRDHLLALDRVHPSDPPHAVLPGATHLMAWSADSHDLGVLIDDKVAHVRVDDVPDAVWRREVGTRNAVAATRTGIYVSGVTGIIARADGPTMRRVAGGYTLALREARGGTMIAADPHGALLALSDDGDHPLASPVGAITEIAASPASPYVAAAGDHVVLVWNLDEIEPQHVADAAPGAALVSHDAALLASLDDAGQWLDLVKGTRTAVGPLTGIASVSTDGQRALVVDGEHHARLIAPGDVRDLDGDIAAAALIDARRFIVATPTELRLHDGDRETTLYAHANCTWLAATPDGLIAAACDDGTLWRGSVTDSKGTSLHLDAPVTAGSLARDGHLLVVAGGELQAWAPNDVKLQGSEQLAPIAALTPSLAAYVATSGELQLADLTGDDHDRWTLAVGKPYRQVRMSPDGRAVLAVTPDAVLLWHIDLPDTPEAAKKQLDELTNASAEAGPTAPLSWR
ncbi:MAG: protein kinase [Deltaproteobacteria bacterium]|nr:protein kinase [Deltaproteobacteria bacterium]